MSASASRRDFAALERRRLQAADSFAAGRWRLAEVARRLQVSRQSVSRWYAQWQQGGKPALRAAGRAGRKPRLRPRQLRSLAQALRKGPCAQGLPGDSWTLPRVTQLIEQATGVKYHPGHVWKLLGAMPWKAAGAGRAAAVAGRGTGSSRGRWLALKRMLAGESPKRR